MTRKMTILDAKSIFGMVVTALSGVWAWIQETLFFLQKVQFIDAWWVPLVPGIPTGIYMLVKAYNAYRSGKKERKQ